MRNCNNNNLKKQIGYAVILAITLQGVYFFTKNYNCKSNVCKTFEDYYTNRDLNKNCYYNPDYLLTVPQIIQRHGYPLETHYATTADGHILTMFRIPHGRHTNTTELGKPVFLQHGFLQNSALFVNVGQKSLGFILANNGYDVWLGNFRGTKYSTNHTRLTRSDSAYWDFSYHEYGVYDLPAQLGYILKETEQKIIFIGFSMGNTAMYIYGMYHPELMSKQIDFSVGLAPATTAHGAISMVRFFRLYHIEFVGRFADKIEVPHSLLRYLCYPYPFQMKLCYAFAYVTNGFHDKQNPETFPSTVAHTYETGSVKSIIHLGQNVESKTFAHFDYGSDKNLKLYGTSEAPLYNLSTIKGDMYFFQAIHDLVVIEKSVQTVRNELGKNTTNDNLYVIKDEDFTHINFLNGRHTVNLVYVPLLELLRTKQLVK